MLSVVCFKWSTPGYRSKFEAIHVNTLKRMVGRHYPDPHRFICVTDDPNGLDGGVEYVPLWNDHANIPNPSWTNGPSCYRRLKVFSEWFMEIAGERFVSVDLDVVITDDLRPLWNRPEPFLMWNTGHAMIPYCGSMFMSQSRENARIWNDFNPKDSPRLSIQDGRMKGSDQAWMAYCVKKPIPGWSTKDGVYSYRDHCVKQYQSKLPKGSRMVIFHGRPDPWDYSALQASPWIHDHYY